MADRTSGDLIRAAGAVVWRGHQDDPRIVLVHRPRYDDWSFPKGKSARGEHVLLTATREIAEETGLQVVLGRRLTSSSYQVGGRMKEVSYWAARCASSAGFVPTREIDELAWLSPAAARDRLSYDRDVVLLDEFLAAPLDTVPFILLRHAEAGPKSPADPLDLARPLDARGIADAKLLADVLVSYGRCRVLSSAAERCVATVRPYAAAIGAEVEIEPAFTVTARAQVAGGGAEGSGTDGSGTDGGGAQGGGAQGRGAQGRGAQGGGAQGGGAQGGGAQGRGAQGRGAQGGGTQGGGAQGRGAQGGGAQGRGAQGGGAQGGWTQGGGTEAGRGLGGGGPGGGGAVAGGRGVPGGGGADRGSAAARAVADLVTGAVPTLICAHRENLPAMVGAARAALGAAPGSASADGGGAAGLALRKGAFLVLAAAGGVLLSEEQHDLHDLAE